MPLTWRVSVKQVLLALVTVTAIPTAAPALGCATAAVATAAVAAIADAMVRATITMATRAPRVDRIRINPSVDNGGRAECTGLRPPGPSLAGTPADHLIRRHGAMEALEAQVADVPSFDRRLEQAENALADEDLSGFRLVAQARSEIGDAADRRIIETPVEPDLSQRRVTERDADAETERVAALAPCLDQLVEALAHSQGHAHRAFGMVGTRHGIIEQDEDAVAGEALQGSFIAKDELAHRLVVLTQHRHHFFRLGDLGETGKAADVAEHHRHFPAMTLQQIGFGRGDEFGDLRCQEAA